ncbi:MAG TPA: ABC transporter ATP-binding protein, partial [Candidatus Mucispirillum faecigallinarum]|nr:ABC transporter ATP-binding protein [Candidatus Mucispirillum faecigallinarum]
MLTVNNVTMKYKIYNDNIKSIKEYFVSLIKGKISYREFTALENISFSINKGDVLGIIGHNGAGKSTLLKIIANVVKPTSGDVCVQGTIAPLLELGAGFDYDLSGRENIYINGAILGYSKNFINSKYEEILEFSELKDFIDVPLRNYSSGMVVRLAFSIATIVKPEILIVDEILAVGDEHFQQKSKNRMLELMSGGCTVIFVSHT